MLDVSGPMTAGDEIENVLEALQIAPLPITVVT